MRTQSEQPRRRSRRGIQPVQAHLETFVNSQTGELINVGCVCSIGESHSYSDWQKRSAYRLAGQRA